MKNLFGFVILSLAVSSCYYDKLEGLYPGGITDPCDASLDATYSGSVQLIINLNCVSCHSGASASGNIRLSNYAEVRSVASNGRLLNVIERNPGFQAMPPSQALSACQIEKVRTWVQNGTPQ